MILAAIALYGCNAPNSAENAQSAKTEVVPPTPLPFDSSTGFLNGFSLRVPRQGMALWNGVPIDDETLTEYIGRHASFPPDADTLFVAFEPGTPQTRIDWVRRQVIDSGLCKQKRCAEVGWDVKRPVVN